METGLVLQIVGGRLDELEKLRNRLSLASGIEPSMHLRLEINLGGEKLVVAVTDTTVEVYDEATRSVVAQGDWEIARAAIRGMPPTAIFNGGPKRGPAPLKVTFKDLSAGAVGYEWDFGDGSTSTEKEPVHTYETAGIYTVSLTVTNPNGEDSVTREALIEATEAR
jgi:PKD repeat protein